ncbi:T-cell surface glycoprotein CD1a, partial [Myotis brandtii]
LFLLPLISSFYSLFPLIYNPSFLDPFEIQVTLGCKLDGGGAIIGFHQFAYQGSELLHFQNNSWLPSPKGGTRAQDVCRLLNQNHASKETIQRMLSDTCPRLLSSILDAGKADLQRQEAWLSTGTNPGSGHQMLVCHVSGFHPKPIWVKWMRGEQVQQGTQQSDILPNADGTWYLQVSLDVKTTETSGLYCQVLHSSLGGQDILLYLDPFEIQITLGCELNHGGAIVGIYGFAYQGSDLLQFQNNSWLPTAKGGTRAQDVSRVFNQYHVTKSEVQSILSDTCPRFLLSILDAGKADLQRQVKPEAWLSTGSKPGPDHQMLVCHVSGFHPKPIWGKWMRGEHLQQGTQQSDILPNADETWYLQVFLDVEATETSGLYCRERHSSLGGQDILLYLEHHQGSVGWIILAVMVPLVLLTALAFWLRKRWLLANYPGPSPQDNITKAKKEIHAPSFQDLWDYDTVMMKGRMIPVVKGDHVTNTVQKTKGAYYS